ncbi:hypothetical protein GGX14DRAFT_574123 [Mycena pura]|uniref:Uncharacterized protein n=1 Tax=Mycena pura TaxID=153505 RepID=A0AAD6UML8_9AGAR|nr:hypothetical protein GGX14DRAFT_581152 [Mycena pura]KAJ7197649.1 hypothetical protein GGX14DRAFT_574123 [Mycena pura]
MTHHSVAESIPLICPRQYLAPNSFGPALSSTFLGHCFRLTPYLSRPIAVAITVGFAPRQTSYDCWRQCLIQPNTAFPRQHVALTHLTGILLTNAQLLSDSRGLCVAPAVAFTTVQSLYRVAAPRTLVWLLAMFYWFPAPSFSSPIRQFAFERSGVSPTALCALLARRSARFCYRVVATPSGSPPSPPYHRLATQCAIQDVLSSSAQALPVPVSPPSMSRILLSFSMPMLWTHSARKTRSSTVFAAWTTDVFAVQATFDIAPLLLKAVAVERDGQEDLEPDDALNDLLICCLNFTY